MLHVVAPHRFQEQTKAHFEAEQWAKSKYFVKSILQHSCRLAIWLQFRVTQPSIQLPGLQLINFRHSALFRIPRRFVSPCAISLKIFAQLRNYRLKILRQALFYTRGYQYHVLLTRKFYLCSVQTLPRATSLKVFTQLRNDRLKSYGRLFFFLYQRVLISCPSNKKSLSLFGVDTPSRYFAQGFRPTQE